MNDKTLLELAAKAAGYEWNKDYLAYLSEEGETWNPLGRDDHALRLAVKLGMNIYAGFNKIFVEIPSDADEPSIVEKNEKGDDPYAATRRAIVRAAAEIGRTM